VHIVIHKVTDSSVSSVTKFTNITPPSGTMLVLTVASRHVFIAAIVRTRRGGSTTCTRTSAPATTSTSKRVPDKRSLPLLTFAIWFVGTHRCPRCDKVYRHTQSLRTHVRFECGKDPTFRCQHCSYVAKRKHHLKTHVVMKHYSSK
jgi:hypothetical protein